MSRPFIICTLAIFLLGALVHAQPEIEWSLHTGHPDGNDDTRMTAFSPDGAVIAAGSYNFPADPGDSTKMFVAKASLDGEWLWTRTYPRAYLAKAKDIVPHSDGGYIITGYTGAGGNQDAMVLRIDEEGNEIWRSIFGYPHRNDVGWRTRQVGPGYLVIANSESSIDDDRDVFLTALGPNGDVIDSQLYGGEREERITALARTSDGDFIFAGKTRTLAPTGYSDVWLWRATWTGQVVWERHFGGLGEDEAFWIESVGVDTFAVAGEWTTAEGGSDLFVMTITADGDSLDGFIYGEAGRAEWAQMVKPKDGDFIVTGIAWGGPLGWQMFLSRFSASGVMRWTLPLGEGGFDRGYNVLLLGDGGYLVGGEYRPEGMDNTQLALFRINPEGTAVDQTPSPAAPPGSSGMVRLYPNPTNGAMTVRLQLPHPAALSFTLHDLLGRRVLRTGPISFPAGETVYPLILDTFPSGTYLLTASGMSTPISRRITLLK